MDAFTHEEVVEALTQVQRPSNDSTGREGDTEQEKWRNNLSSVTALFQGMPTTHTVVMEAAFHLLRSHVFVNKEQAHALLRVAAWLQCRMSDIWAEEGTLEHSPYGSSAAHAKELQMVLLGP